MRYFLRIYRAGSHMLAMDVYGNWYQSWYGHHWMLSTWAKDTAPRYYSLIAKSVMFKCPA